MTNPAGMTRLDERAFSVGGLVAYSLGEFEIDEARTSVDGGNPDSNNAPVIVPSAYYVEPIGERLRAGVSLTIPSGFGADYGGDWAGRYYTDNYALVYVALTPAIAYKLNDSVSIGGSISLNYTSSTAETRINTLSADGSDGRLKAELSGVGVSATFGVLWELDEHTRFGVAYTSESEAELEGDAKLRGLGPVLDPVLGQGDIDVEIDNRLPQRVIAGLYHELNDDWSMTADLLWVEFSKFGTTGASIEGYELNLDPQGIYDDIWGVTLGATRRLSACMELNMGAFWVSQPVDDSDRSLSMRLDSMYGLGAGVNYQLDAKRSVDVSLTLINYGEAPVDTGPSVLRGRIVGENDTPYSVLLGLAWHF